MVNCIDSKTIYRYFLGKFSAAEIFPSSRIACDTGRSAALHRDKSTVIPVYKSKFLTLLQYILQRSCVEGCLKATQGCLKALKDALGLKDALRLKDASRLKDALRRCRMP